jgi:hypothetical protein
MTIMAAENLEDTDEERIINVQDIDIFICGLIYENQDFI